MYVIYATQGTSFPSVSDKFCCKSLDIHHLVSIELHKDCINQIYGPNIIDAVQMALYDNTAELTS